MYGRGLDGARGWGKGGVGGVPENCGIRRRGKIIARGRDFLQILRSLSEPTPITSPRPQNQPALTRVTLHVRAEDAPLLHAVAAALADPARAVDARSYLKALLDSPPAATGLKELLASAPLEGVDLTR